MKILFDFDGTLIDVWQRYYKVFSDLAKPSNLNLCEYKQVKRMLEKDSLIADYFKIQLPDDYYPQKGEMLEKMEYLSLDKLLIERDRIVQFASEHDVQILTRRRNEANFYRELNLLNLKELKPKSTVLLPAICHKKDWIQDKCGQEQVIIVGDGQEEIDAAILGNVTVLLVNTGLKDVSKVAGGQGKIFLFETPLQAIEWIEEKIYGIS